jgi:hypothetical protein
MKTLKEYINMLISNIDKVDEPYIYINEDWFKIDSFETFKLGTIEHYEKATQAGSIDTLESNGKPQQYEACWYIMTGPAGGKYSIPPETFAMLKDDNGDGTCTPKKIIKVAKLADHNGMVNTSWGEPLYYTVQNDFIVRHGANDYGVVKAHIFRQTYDTSNMVDNKRSAP